MMHGPEIIARSISKLRIPDQFGNKWQYHSRSDRHSKLTCWSLMFDLITHCPMLKQHISDHKVGFGINHEMRDFRTQRKKNLDLVICTPQPGALPILKRGKFAKKLVANFSDLADECEVVLTESEKSRLASLPLLQVVPVGSVCLALEAKAMMTEHVKALPRIHDELDSSHLTVHGHADHAIAAALVTINFADEFCSTDRNKRAMRKGEQTVTAHAQPKVTLRAIEKIHEIRRRSVPSEQGFDALGIMLVDFKNDGNDIKVVTKTPAPQPSDDFHYDRLIDRICSQYRAKFQGL
jgi:hypothetical protein